MPGAILLGEVAGAPVNRGAIGKDPAKQAEDAAHFFPRLNIGYFGVTSLPHPAYQGEEGDQFDRLLDIEDGHPVGRELGRKRIESIKLAKGLLIDTHADIEDADGEHASDRRLPIISERFRGGGFAGACRSSY